MGKIKNPKDLLMLLLYANGPKGEAAEPIQGQTRLMKMVFLFQRELAKQFQAGLIDEKAFPNFVPFDYGPYSPQVYSDLEFLVNLGFVMVANGNAGELSEEERGEFDYWSATTNPDRDLDTTTVGRTFILTGQGKRFVETKLWPNLNDVQKQTLHEFKKRCVGTSLRSLLRYVYTKYQDMTTRSLIKHEILH